MSATIRRNHIVDFVIGNRGPFAVHLDLVMVANHATLRRATVHEVAARASAVVSLKRKVKPRMPLIVADPVMAFLRPRRHTEEYGHRADYRPLPRKLRKHERFP
jgi:hypothetical protein